MKTELKLYRPRQVGPKVQQQPRFFTMFCRNVVKQLDERISRLEVLKANFIANHHAELK